MINVLSLETNLPNRTFCPQIVQPDFGCFNRLLVEIKAVSRLTGEHRAQILNYLNASGHEVALLVNFGHFPKLEYVRIVNQGRGKLRPPCDGSRTTTSSPENHHVDVHEADPT